MTLCPKYTRVEHLQFLLRLEQANAPQSMNNAFTAVGAEARGVMGASGPCMPTSLAIATGQTVEAVAQKMQAVYTDKGTVMEGTSLCTRECEGVPAVMAAATKGVPNCDLVKRPIFEGGSVSRLVKESAKGRTYVAIVSGGAHALTVKGGDIYCLAGRTGRAKVRYCWEVV